MMKGSGPILFSIVLFICILSTDASYQTFLAGNFVSLGGKSSPSLVSYSIGTHHYDNFNYVNNTNVHGLNGPVTDMAVSSYLNDTYFFAGNFSGLLVSKLDDGSNTTIPGLNSIARYSLNDRKFYALENGIRLPYKDAKLSLLTVHTDLYVYGPQFTIINDRTHIAGKIAVWSVSQETWNLLETPKCKDDEVEVRQLIQLNNSLVGLFDTDKGATCISEYSLATKTWKNIQIPAVNGITNEINFILNYNITDQVVMIGNFQGPPKTEKDKYYPCKIYSSKNNTWTQCAGYIKPNTVEKKLVVKITAAIVNDTSVIIGGTFMAGTTPNIAQNLVISPNGNKTTAFQGYSGGLAAQKGKTVINAITTGPTGLAHFLFASGNFKSSTFATGAWIDTNEDNTWKTMHLNSSDTITKMLHVIGVPPKMPESFPTQNQIILSIVIIVVTTLTMIFGCCGIVVLPEKD